MSWTTASPAPSGRELSRAVLDELGSVVGAANLRTGAAVAELDPGESPANLGAGILLAPGSTEEVAAIVRICRRHHVPIVPQGGRTGLVGGAESRPGEAVVWLGRMKRIERLDPVERVAVVEAGVRLQALQDAALEHRLEPGIDLASRGSAMIGGMASTNAGGIMAFRYGVMRHRVLGLEAVLADGSVYRDLTRVVKNTAGYDLKHLFIGAEGTLGIVTRVAMKLEPLPPATATALFGLPSVGAALEAIRWALDPEAGTLRAAEALWRSYIRSAAACLGWSEPGFPLDHPICLLMEVGGTEEEALREAFQRLFAAILERFPEANGIIAGSKRQEAELWRLREESDILYRSHPGAPTYDVSVPLSAIDAYVSRIVDGLAAVEPGLEPFLYGHLADGNLHIVLNREGPLPESLAAAVEAVLYADLRAIGGSFSAEHGVGSKRIHSLLATADPTKLRLIDAVRRALDEEEILNSGKVLPPLAARSA